MQCDLCTLQISTNVINVGLIYVRYVRENDVVLHSNPSSKLTVQFYLTTREH
jgi:hypothetical protein